MKAGDTWRWWMAVAAWAAAAGGTSAGTYLAADGPPALRFAQRGRSTAVKTVLPPLSMVSADTGSTNDLAVASEPPPDSRAEETVGPTPPDANVTPPSQPIVIPPAALAQPQLAPGVAVTPGVLLNYFGPAGTNVMGPVVLSPVSFIPPQPGVPASSRATYRQVP